MESTRLLKNVLFYFLGTLSKLLQILLIPVYSLYINPSEFGYFNLIISIIALSIPLLYQSIWEGVLRFTIEKQGNERKVITTATYYSIGLTVIYSLLFLIFHFVLNLHYGIGILLMGIFQIASSFWQFTARALNKNKIYTLSIIAESVVMIMLNIILIVFFNVDILALFIANIAGKIVLILIIESDVKLLAGLKKSDFDITLLKSIIKYSLPLSVNAVSWWLISSSNTLIISYKLGIEQNGIFSLANRFGALMTLFTTVLNMAWLEESFRIHGEKDSDDYFNKILDILIRFILIGVAILIPATYIFYQFFVFGDYKSGVVLTPIIYLNAALSAIVTHLGSGFLANKESKVIFQTTLIGGVISIILAYIGANIFGVIGVVAASLIGTISMFAFRVPMLKKRMILNINYSILFGLSLTCVALMVISHLYKEFLVVQLIILIIVGLFGIFVNKRLVFSLLKKSLR
ncbi:lipopolysaccharide biosynthesis protein [Mesobacillus jeotgali]|uniref:lipopolysaccharide biosynthesis protein n=1 Tax=Mesobacillus jeotgali TaxID=129985 RepID=UPI00177DF3BA|nr:oligosaccharide flippase family protein [Mesobacillus jeotgali]UYZ21793.1 oligosaccharide flippase family protein [Mesobacillus jeotgali]